MWYVYLYSIHLCVVPTGGHGAHQHVVELDDGAEGARQVHALTLEHQPFVLLLQQHQHLLQQDGEQLCTRTHTHTHTHTHTGDTGMEGWMDGWKEGGREGEREGGKEGGREGWMRIRSKENTR